MQALLVDRPGNAPLTEEVLKMHTLVKSLDEVDIVPNIADVLMNAQRAVKSEGNEQTPQSTYTYWLQSTLKHECEARYTVGEI